MPRRVWITPSEVSQDPDEVEAEVGLSDIDIIKPEDITPVSTVKHKAKTVKNFKKPVALSINDEETVSMVKWIWGIA